MINSQILEYQCTVGLPNETRLITYNLKLALFIKLLIGQKLWLQTSQLINFHVHSGNVSNIEIKRRLKVLKELL